MPYFRASDRWTSLVDGDLRWSIQKTLIGLWLLHSWLIFGKNSTSSDTILKHIELLVFNFNVGYFSHLFQRKYRVSVMVCSQKVRRMAVPALRWEIGKRAPIFVASPKHVVLCLFSPLAPKPFIVGLLSSLPDACFSRVWWLHYWWTDSRLQKNIWTLILWQFRLICKP